MSAPDTSLMFPQATTISIGIVHSRFQLSCGLTAPGT
jgi:hypothetical protein